MLLLTMAFAILGTMFGEIAIADSFPTWVVYLSMTVAIYATTAGICSVVLSVVLLFRRDQSRLPLLVLVEAVVYFAGEFAIVVTIVLGDPVIAYFVAFCLTWALMLLSLTSRGKRRELLKLVTRGT